MLHVQINNLTKRFGYRLVLNQVQFHAKSEILGISGKNGSGKTTLLRCLAGLIKPSSGTVEWYDKDTLLTREQQRENIGLSGPWLQMYRELSCRENLTFLARLHTLADPQQVVDYTLAQVGLSQHADKPYGRLSSGQQQRLKLASAMLHQPNALLLDEPGTNLDDTGMEIIQALLHFWRSTHRLVILASNNPQELDGCDRVISISNP
jgi:heme ABC exporter ATP-binding subunit CcmA